MKWPVALATLLVLLLGWYLLYTERIVRALQSDAATFAEIYFQVQTALTTAPSLSVEGREDLTDITGIFDEGAAVDESSLQVNDALFELQQIILNTGFPIVLTVPRAASPGGDSVVAVANLPFEANLETVAGQSRVLRYVERLDARYDPVGAPDVQHIHYGDPPLVRRLRWIPFLQVTGLLLTVAVGFTVVRSQRRAENERAWTSMARELAHQLGTPISSLQGWLEVLRLSADERPGGLDELEIARSIQEDLVRLERISHRFELIGHDPHLEPVSVRKVVRDLERYLQSRLPRFGSGVDLKVESPARLPSIQGNEVLLAWALENVVKNSLDALAGRGGQIRIRVLRGDPGWIVLRISDDGPGVDPALRESIFDPGVSTKTGGWGVGLTLSRRIVEGVHGGRIALLDGPGGGATFQVRLPVAEPAPSEPT